MRAALSARVLRGRSWCARSCEISFRGARRLGSLPLRGRPAPARCAQQSHGRNMRLEGRNPYVTSAELDRISELKDDANALAKYLGPDICASIPREVGLAPNPVLDAIAAWRRLLSGLTILVESVPVAAPM